MKIALITDTHFGARNDSLAFNEYFYKFWEDIFFPYLDEHNIKTVIHLGDLMDRRKFVSYKIANHLSYRPNFINYTYRDEMISDGIENCLQYASNFNPEKSNNPFAYFTQIIYYAFIRRIQKEKKQQHVRHKIIENMTVDMMGGDADGEQAAFVDYLQANYLPSEAVYKPKKKKTQPKGLEKFYDEEDVYEPKGDDVDEDSTNN